MAVFLSYFLISMEENQLEKFYLSSIWNLETLCQDTETPWKTFSLSKSKCLTQPIEMQLSRNREIFSEFFSPSFWNLHKILNTLKKIWFSEVICFWHYWLQKAELLKCLKIPVSGHFWVVKTLKPPKQCLNRPFCQIFWRL